MRRAIEWMANNGVAANVLLAFVLFAGIFGALQLEQEVIPEIILDTIEIRVPYPGASPEEIEAGILERIEERLEGIEGIREITSTAAEGVGVVRAELDLGEDVRRRLDEVKSEIDRITSFPEEAEEPEIVEVTNRRRVMEIAIWGDADPRVLKQLAYRAEDEITRLPPVSFVEVTGMPAYEISIEVPRETLRAYGLTLPEIAAAVRRASLDLPAGDIETRDEDIVVRVQGQRYRGAEFEDIIIASGPAGDVVRLRDIATVQDAFADEPISTLFNGESAVLVQVFRTGDERVLDIADAVHAYVEERLRPSLPPGAHATVWQDDAELLASRFSLLLENGAIGIFLVIVTLTLFLDLRLALWVAVGILVSFIGTFAVMTIVGTSINMLSLFGFILAIGIVVDDAIVVGENAFSERRLGGSGIEATVRGTQRVAIPVFFAVLTTIIAFLPLLFVPGTTGKFIRTIPIVVISVLGLSLLESLFVLPHHLAVLAAEPRGRILRAFGRAQARVDRGMTRFIEGPLRRGLRLSTRHPGTVLAGGLAITLVCGGLVAGGFVKFVYFPRIESDYVTVAIRMPAGTPEHRTRAVARRIALTARDVGDAMQRELETDAADLVRNIVVGVGQTLQPTGPTDEGAAISLGNRGSVIVQLAGAEERDVPADLFEQRWREAVGELPGGVELTFVSDLVGFGAPVQVELSLENEARYGEALGRVEDALRRIEGVYDVTDDYEEGQRELQIGLLPAGRALGLTLEDLAQQLRAAYYGVEAERVQRGPEEVRVYVRLPPGERGALAQLYEYRIRAPGGGAIPLREVATIQPDRGPVTIQRRAGRRIATITAQVDPAVVTGDEVADVLGERILPPLADDFEGLEVELGGEQRERAESLPALWRNFSLALVAIFVVLAISFRSYGQPLVVMAAIPFGMVGAVLGHFMLGLDVSMLSLFGLVGLSGVIVNDSLVMMDFVNERLQLGDARSDAIVNAAESRFRPILLTSLTTFLGVFPLVIERSLQAQFLIPLAVSIGFGVLIGTFILMLVVSSFAELHLRWTGR